MHPRRKKKLLATVRATQSLPPEKFPQIIRHFSQRPSEAEFRRFRELEKIRNHHAHELGIDPTLGDLARDWDQHAPDLMSWQRELLK
jgi:ribonuclease D